MTLRKCRRIIHMFIIVVSVMGLANCGFTNDKGGSGSTPGAGGVPAPAPGASGVPAATFTQVNQQILQPSCVSCHSGGQSPDLSSYSGFATNTAYVVPGNAGSSLIYTITASGQMPLNGGALSSSQLSLLASWIDAGAPND